MDKIKIVPTKMHKEQMKEPGVRHEFDEIQAIFDTRSFLFQDGTINFTIIKGLYSHIERTMKIIGVFVNTTGKTICGLKALLQFHSRVRRNVRFGEIRLELPPSSLGEIQRNEGFILHLNVPVQGLHADKEVYDAPELTGAVKEIEVVHPK